MPVDRPNNFVVNRFSAFFELQLGRLGKKPNKEFTLRLILNSFEISGSGWKISNERTLRTAAFRRDDPINHRTLEMGSTTVQRKFRNKGLGRGFFLQISPLSNSEDAASRVEDFEQRLLERLANILSSEKYGESLSIDLPRANRVKGVKYKVVINGKERNDLAIAFNVENVFSVIVCSFFEESWNIHDAIQLASEQAIKIWDNLEIA